MSRRTVPCNEPGMNPRREYVLDLTSFLAPAAFTEDARFQLRAAMASDVNALSELMIDAYQGTIDYAGESLEDAMSELQAYLKGRCGGPPLLERSCLAFAGPTLAGACLPSDWDIRPSAFIPYIMTRAKWKNLGVAQQVLRTVLHGLREDGHREVRTIITIGNTPSEKVFARMGFKEAPEPPPVLAGSDATDRTR